jgi:glucosamine-6-phosphate deaminase
VRLAVHRNERDVAAAVAQRLGADLEARPSLVLGLATGRTTIPVYQRLAAIAGQGRADFTRAATFNLDEFWRLPASHPGSCRAFMVRHLFGHVRIPAAQIHFLDGTARDAAEECARYERAIADAGGIDVQVLGIGANGHIGFNEPAVALQARTHLATLKPQARRANAAFFGDDAAAVPAQALSMGMATLLQARSIVLVATGRGKGRAVERMVNGPLTTRLPASFLQVHRDVEVVLDEAAAERITSAQRARP